MHINAVGAVSCTVLLVLPCLGKVRCNRHCCCLRGISEL